MTREQIIRAHPALYDRLGSVAQMLAQADVEDVVMNRPGEAWVYRTGKLQERVDAPDMTLDRVIAFGKLLASQFRLVWSDARPRISATLPTGERCELLFPPLVEDGKLALSIRRQTVADFTLADLIARGMFEGTAIVRRQRQRPSAIHPDIEAAAAAGDAAALLAACARAERSIIVGGQPGAGKTAVTKATVKEIPHDQRILTIEDVLEIKPPQPNALALKLSFSAQSTADVSVGQIMESVLRLRPDRLVFGELRGIEALAFVEALNTGIPGVITTIHANSAADIVWRLAELLHKYDGSTPLPDALSKAENYLDVLVFVSRKEQRRRVLEIQYS